MKQNPFEATVTASDGVNSNEQLITVTIENLNDNIPVFVSLASFTVKRIS